MKNEKANGSCHGLVFNLKLSSFVILKCKCLSMDTAYYKSLKPQVASFYMIFFSLP
jgi:hypothetical protein